MNILKNILRKFKRDDRGVITLELIVLMPFMVLWIVGSNSFYDGFKTYLRASKATYTAIDLISRQESFVGPNYIANVGSVFNSIVDADGAPSTVIISSIGQANGSLFVHWTANANGGAGIPNAGAIPTAFIPVLMDGEYIVLIQSSVPFIPIHSWGNLTAKTFTNTVAVTPRFNVKVEYDSSY
jgi:Flp pilus assembly protein TadG